MSYEPLHHKYRPQTFAGLVGQEAIATTLSNAIASRKIAPAYMFTGPRGTGKTSSARILAKSLNCLNSDVPTATPCGHCEVCKSIARGSALDVIEIDAASNTGVDNIREIIERAQFAPVQCRYKVYAIDECHMLSTAAFNALLKTLEEPPARVVFVLATTDPQRVLTTIISRCQRFDFRRIPLGSMVKHLSAIADKESIEIADEAITLVAQIANGGLRDAESLLDQLSLLAGKVTVERVWDLVGAVPERNLLRLLQAIRADQAEAVIEECRHLMDRGREPLAVLQSLTGFYLNLSIAKNAPQRQDLVAVTETTWKALCEEAQHWQTAIILHSQQHLKESEPQLRHSTQPRLWLEVTLLGLLPSARRYKDTDAIAPSTPAQPAAQATPQAPPQPATTVNHPTTQEPAQRPTSAPSQAAQPQSTASPQSRVQQTWQEVLKQLRPLPEAFVKQHCKLVNFDLDAEVAYISVRNTNLLPTAERFKPEIEKAFEQAWQETIRVQFQLENRSSQSFGSPQPSVQPTPQPSPASSEAVSTPNLSPSPSPPPRDRSDTPKSTSNGTSNPIQNGYSLQTQVQEKPLVEPSPPPRDRPGTQNGYSPQTQVQEKPPIEPSPAPQSATAEDNASTIATDIATAEQPIETPSASNEEMDKAVQRVMQLFGGEAIDW
jgi:DNA polymerase-3 subunit gamma/tau